MNKTVILLILAGAVICVATARFVPGRESLHVVRPAARDESELGHHEA